MSTPLILKKKLKTGELSSRSQFTGQYCGVNMYQIQDRDFHNQTELRISSNKTHHSTLNNTVSFDMGPKKLLPVLSKKKNPIHLQQKNRDLQYQEVFETNYSLPPTLPNFQQTFTEEFNFKKIKNYQNSEIRQYIKNNSSNLSENPYSSTQVHPKWFEKTLKTNNLESTDRYKNKSIFGIDSIESLSIVNNEQRLQDAYSQKFHKKGLKFQNSTLSIPEQPLASILSNLGTETSIQHSHSQTKVSFIPRPSRQQLPWNNLVSRDRSPVLAASGSRRNVAIIQLLQKQKKNKQILIGHQIQSGRQVHLNYYRSELEKREIQIQKAMESHVEQFSDKSPGSSIDIKEIGKMVPIDHMDFEFKKALEGGCNECAPVRGQKVNFVRKDPKLYDFIIKYRNLLKKLPVQVSDDPILMNESSTHSLLDKLEKQEKFRIWQEQMWRNLAKRNHDEEVARRPIYINHFSEAKEAHLKQYFEILDCLITKEQVEKESLWKNQQTIADFKKSFLYLMQKQDLTEEEFFHELIKVTQKQERQDQYFKDITSKIFVDKSKSTMEALHDGDIQLKPATETERSKKFILELMQTRMRESFLQKDLKQIFNSENQESSSTFPVEYAKQCHKNNGLPKPKIAICPEGLADNHYVLINETLPMQQSESIANGIQNLNYKVRQLYFANNKMTGRQFSNILQSLSENQVKDIKSIVYVGQNEFDGQNLQNYLKKRAPYALVELKLLGLKCELDVLPNLITDLRNDFKLQSLSLSKLNLDVRSVELLIKIFENRPSCLKEVDISWNKIKTSQIKAICKAIKNNQFIRSLNIGFNPVSRSDDIKELAFFVRNNPNLQHLDVSGVLQTPSQVMKIIKKAKKTQSLLSIHLSYIPMDDNMIQYIIDKLDAKDERKKVENAQLFQKMDLQLDWKEKYELVKRIKIQDREALYFNEMIIQHPSKKTGSKLIVQRTLSHFEIPGNGQWILNDECYGCNRWKYTVFFSTGPEQLTGTFQLLNHGINPVIKPIDVRLFAKILLGNSDFEDYKTLLPKESLAEMEQKSWKKQQLKDRYEKKDLTLFQDHNLWYKIVVQKIYDSASSCQYFPIKPSPFDIHFYNKQELAGTNPNLFVFADYMRPSQRIERLKYISSKHEEYFVPEVRKDSLPLFQLPKYTAEDNGPRFFKDQTVFKGWVEDTPQVIAGAIKSDLSYWKAAKFVKDPEDFQKCSKLIKERYLDLKNIFVNLISGDNYPHIGWNDFVAFCRDVEILDGTIPTSTVDRYFLQTKVGAPTGVGAGNTLFRYEFLEIMIRIANAKYKETGRAESYSESLEMMLDSIIDKFKTKPWQQFREEELWTNECDAVFKVNMDYLTRIHGHLIPTYAGQEGLRNCVELVSRGSEIDLSEKEAKFCFGMSKMTVKDEVKNHAEYDKLKFVEFIEFIGRVAYTRYIDDDDASLNEKIERILDQIFRVYGYRRNPVPEMIVTEFSSDDSVKGFKASERFDSI